MRMVVAGLVLVGWLALGSATAADARGSERLLGWSADATYFMVEGDPGQREDGSVPYDVCATSDADSATFPSWVRASITLGELCFSSDDVGVPGLRALVPRVRKASAGAAPLGLKVTVATGDDDNITATFTRGKAKHTESRPFYGEGKVKLRKVYWRPDGSAAIVEVSDGTGSRSWFGFGLRALVPAKPGAKDAALGAALNLEGLARYREGDHHAARVAFTQAVAADPTLPAAHYNLAAISAIFGDVEVARRELGWLRASKDKRSKVFLDKVPRDDDFSRISDDPEHRKLVGLPPMQPNLEPMGRLLETRLDGALWSLPAATCEQRTIVLSFSVNTVKATLRSCPEWDGVKADTLTGIWTPNTNSASIELALPGLPKGKLPISFERCPGSTRDAGCMRIGAKPGLGPFHRGVAPDPAEVAARRPAP